MSVLIDQDADSCMQEVILVSLEFISCELLFSCVCSNHAALPDIISGQFLYNRPRIYRRQLTVVLRQRRRRWRRVAAVSFVVINRIGYVMSAGDR